MKVQYDFEFGENDRRSYVVDIDRPAPEKSMPSQTHPEWTRLGHCQCSNCPLKKTETTFCPAAVDIEQVVNDFRTLNAFQKVKVRVTTEGRTYEKYTGLEEALRSLMGLIMATSHCPILGQLRPMAIHHMPFASADEFILRTVSLYLLQQHYQMRANKTPDWELKGLVERNRQLQLVNQALWQRIHAVCESDSNLKALLSFFSLSSSVSFSLETQLQKLRGKIDPTSSP